MGMTARRREQLSHWLRACHYEGDPAILAARPLLPLVIGEAPNRSGEGSDPKEIFATGRLARHGDIARYERTNVLKEWPGGDGAGSSFPLALARPAARSIHDEQPIDRPFLIVGTRTAQAFGLGRRRYDYLEWWEETLFDQPGLRRLAVCPHPSGLNQWWNDPTNCEVAAHFFRELIGDE